MAKTFNMGGLAGAYAINERGIWTPTIVSGSIAVTNIMVAEYYRIGSLVYVRFTATITPTASPTTAQIIFGGLPFPISAAQTMLIGFSNDVGIAISVGAAPATLQIRYYNNIGNQAYMNAQQFSGGVKYINALYFTDAEA